MRSIVACYELLFNYSEELSLISCCHQVQLLKNPTNPHFFFCFPLRESWKIVKALSVSRWLCESPWSIMLWKTSGLLKPGKITQKALIFICNNRHGHWFLRINDFLQNSLMWVFLLTKINVLKNSRCVIVHRVHGSLNNFYLQWHINDSTTNFFLLLMSDFFHKVWIKTAFSKWVMTTWSSSQTAWQPRRLCMSWFDHHR